MSHFKYSEKNVFTLTKNFQELHPDTANLFTRQCFYLQFMLKFLKSFEFFDVDVFFIATFTSI